MNPSSHPHGHRRHSRRGRLQVVMLALAVGFIVFLVAGLVWYLSSPRFAKPY